MDKKITKKEKFAMLLEMDEVKDNEMLVAFLENEIELLNRKAAKPAKATKNQEANAVLAEKVFNVLDTFDTAMTVTEIQKADAELAEFSNQKLSAVLNRILVKENRVIKVQDKNKTLFSVAAVQE